MTAFGCYESRVANDWLASSVSAGLEKLTYHFFFFLSLLPHSLAHFPPQKSKTSNRSDPRVMAHLHLLKAQTD